MKTIILGEWLETVYKDPVYKNFLLDLSATGSYEIYYEKDEFRIPHKDNPKYLRKAILHPHGLLTFSNSGRKKEFYLESLVVDKQYRNQKIARSLIEFWLKLYPKSKLIVDTYSPELLHLCYNLDRLEKFEKDYPYKILDYDEEYITENYFEYVSDEDYSEIPLDQLKMLIDTRNFAAIIFSVEEKTKLIEIHKFSTDIDKLEYSSHLLFMNYYFQKLKEHYLNYTFVIDYPSSKYIKILENNDIKIIHTGINYA